MYLPAATAVFCPVATSAGTMRRRSSPTALRSALIGSRLPDPRLKRGDRRGELQRFGRRQVGDRGPEQDPRQELVLRQRRRAGEGDLGLEAGALHEDAGIEPLDLRLGVDVEQRIGRALAAEADRAAVEPEVAAGEIIIAADEVGAAGEARRVGEAADVEVGRPAAVDARARSPGGRFRRA